MSVVLIVEDEESYRDALGFMLAKEGFEVILAADGEEGLAQFERHGADIVLLDLMMPGLSGTEVCRRLRQRSSVPIIMVTARDSEIDKVVGLELGADDYVTKPFRLAELLARVRALLRRTAGDASEGDLVAQDVRVDVAAHRAFVGERELQLTAKEFDLLRVLVREAGNVVERDALMREVWGSDPSGSTKTLDMHVSWLRRKLGDDAADPRYITTVRGMGFRFETGKD